jgi:methionyl-tRNA synthetase
MKRFEDKYNEHLRKNPNITPEEWLELFGKFIEEGYEIERNRKICRNCEHLSWGIGIGQGLRCINPQKEVKNKMIDNSQHTCELFEFKH